MPSPVDSILPSSSGADPKVVLICLTTQTSCATTATKMVLSRTDLRVVVVKTFGMDDILFVISLVSNPNRYKAPVQLIMFRPLPVCAVTSVLFHHGQWYSSQHSQGQIVAAFDHLLRTEKVLALSPPVGISSALCSTITVSLFRLRTFRSVWRRSILRFLGILYGRDYTYSHCPSSLMTINLFGNNGIRF